MTAADFRERWLAAPENPAWRPEGVRQCASSPRPPRPYRLAAARSFLGGRPPAAEIIIVGASRGAADDLARAISRDQGATFGITRFSLTELAARAAASYPAERRRIPGTQAGAEAVAAHAVFGALEAGELGYFEPVARMPGFPKALARTLHELRLAGVRTTDHADRMDPAQADLFRLLDRVESEMSRAGVDDRAALFHLAAAACRAGHVRAAKLPMVLLDIPLDSRAEQQFAKALIAGSPDVLATVPEGDAVTLDRAFGARRDSRAILQISEVGTQISDLECLRRYVFRVRSSCRA